MIRIRMLAPLPKILGLAETNSSTVLELPVGPEASLQTLFSRLSTQYPAFGALIDPNHSGELQGIIVAVNRKHVPKSEYSQTLLQEGSEVSLFPPYGGG